MASFRDIKVGNKLDIEVYPSWDRSRKNSTIKVGECIRVNKNDFRAAIGKENRKFTFTGCELVDKQRPMEYWDVVGYHENETE